MYHVLYNNSAGKKTISKYQRTYGFTRKLCALLYYIHTTMYNRINYNRPCVLVKFHTRRRFRASLSVRASNSSHLVTYARQFCTNNPGHKIYPWVSVRSTLHHTILHNPTILHTRKFLHQPSTCVIYTDV